MNLYQSKEESFICSILKSKWENSVLNWQYTIRHHLFVTRITDINNFKDVYNTLYGLEGLSPGNKFGLIY